MQKKMAQAEAMRKKDEETFTAGSNELKANIKAFAKAIQALESGSSNSFLQTDEAAVLRRLVDSDRLPEDTREAMTSLLGMSEDSGNSDEDAAPSSEVIGICKQLQESFEENLAKVVKQEKDDVKEFEMLQESSKKEGKALVAAIKSKTERVAEVRARIVDIDDDAESTSESLQRDKVFVEQMQTTCSTLESTYSEHQRMRGEEVLTLAQTIKILGNDDTKELFALNQQASPAASFLQVRSRGGSSLRKQEAIKLLRAAKAEQKEQSNLQVNLLLLALKGKKANFGRILKMVDDMLATLKSEDAADVKKKRSCMKENEETSDSLVDIKEEIKSKSKVITDREETLKTLKVEIGHLADKIKQIDKAMAQSTSDRKANHEDFVQLLEKNRKAADIIEQAKERLMKFYNPKVAAYKPKEDKEQVASQKGKTNPNLFGPGAMGMMRGMTGFDQEAADEQEVAEVQDEMDAEASSSSDEEVPPPKGPGKLKNYVKSNQASASALELLNSVRNEILRDTAEAQQEEKNHKASYQMMLQNANKKRASMVRTLMSKQRVKATLEEDIHKLRGKRAQSESVKSDLTRYFMSLQQDCDFLLKNFQLRYASRVTQRNALTQAQTILAGAGGKST